MKKIISLMISLALVLGTMLSCTVSVSAAEAVIEKDGVMQLGDVTSVTEGYFVYYPKELATSDKVYPVAVWANGTACAPALYYDLLVGVAKKGYIVVACSDTMPKDGTSQIACIDYIFNLSMDEKSPLFGKVDPNRVGAFGHSQGGLSTVNAALADNRIGAIVSIAGASTASQAKNLTTPALFLTGTLDTVVLSALWVEPSYNAVKGPAAFTSLNNGIHTSCMLDAPSYVNHIVNWFNAWLNEDGDISAFQNGKEFSGTAWKYYKSKNMTRNLAGSMFGEVGAAWIVIGVVAVLTIIAVHVVLYKKRKKLLTERKD